MLSPLYILPPVEVCPPLASMHVSGHGDFSMLGTTPHTLISVMAARRRSWDSGRGVSDMRWVGQSSALGPGLPACGSWVGASWPREAAALASPKGVPSKEQRGGSCPRTSRGSTGLAGDPDPPPTLLPPPVSGRRRPCFSDGLQCHARQSPSSPGCVLVTWAAIKYHRLGGLKQYSLGRPDGSVG